MFVENFITISFINCIELGLQDMGGMLKLGCDQKSGPLNHASTLLLDLTYVASAELVWHLPLIRFDVQQSELEYHASLHKSKQKPIYAHGKTPSNPEALVLNSIINFN